MLICSESSNQEMLQRGDQPAAQPEEIYKAFWLEYQGIKNLSWVQLSDRYKLNPSDDRYSNCSLLKSK